MDRRHYLRSLGAAGLSVAAAGCSTIQARLNNAAGGKGEFNFTSHGFKSARWTEDHRFEVTLAESHDMDGFGVRYATKEEPRDDIHARSAPKYGGSVTIDLLPMLVEDGAPAGSYELVAYKGSLLESGGGVVTETIGSVPFSIKPSPSITQASHNSDHTISIQMENSGNAPAYVETATVDRQVSVKQIVGVGTNTLISTIDSPYKVIGGCIIVRPSADLTVSCHPSTQVSGTVEAAVDEKKQFCDS